MRKQTFIFKLIGLTFISLLIFQFKSQITYADTSKEYEYTVWHSNASITKYIGNETEVTIPDSIDGYKVTGISDYAFSSQESITSIVIPNSVLSIGKYAFEKCISLKSITMPSSIKRLDSYLFYRCISLTSVNIPDNVEIIGLGAFEECTSLTNITIPNSVKYIGLRAFYNCSSLANITIPSSVSRIESDTFYGCTSLTAVDIADGNIAYTSENGVVYDKLKSTLVYYPAAKLDTSFYLPDSVTKLQGGALSSCPNLTAINVGSENTVFSSENGVFYNKAMTNLLRYPAGKTDMSFTIPSTVNRIAFQAFKDCGKILNISIPNSVTYISQAAFTNCSNLRRVVIPNGIINIENQTFSGCTSLSSVSIPNSVTSIGDEAFYECSSLKNINIPESITSIGRRAFANCTSLTEAKFFGNAPYIRDDLFNGCAWDFKVYYLDGKTGFGNRWSIYKIEAFLTQTYTVTFNSKGGSAVESKSVEYNSTLLKPEEPSKTGFTFGGWYIDDYSFKEGFNFSETPVLDNIILYSKWIPTEAYVAGYVEQALQTKLFGIYNEALGAIYESNLSDEIKAYYIDKLASVDSAVFTEINRYFINKCNAIAANPNHTDYLDLVGEIDDKLNNDIDKGYFKGQMNSWGRNLVYTPQVQSAIEAIGKVWELKTFEAVKAAKSEIALVKQEGSVVWLCSQLDEAVQAIPKIK